MNDTNQTGGKCQGVLANAVARSNETQFKLYFDKIIEVQSKSFEHAVRANNVNVTIIYAGAFLLIQATSGLLPSSDWSLIVLLLSISLLTFAVWSVSSSYRISKQTILASKLMSDPTKTIERKLAEFEVLERQAQTSSLRYYGTWGWVFSVTLLSGFTGAIYLFILFALNLIGVSFSPLDWAIIRFSSLFG